MNFRDPIEHYAFVLTRLLSSLPLPFDSNLRGSLPNVGGVYRVFEASADWDKSVYVGETINLQNRIYSDLLMGNLPRHTLKRKLIDRGHSTNKQAAKAYLKEKCAVQFVEIDIERERKYFEHFAIAVLKPAWND